MRSIRRPSTSATQGTGGAAQHAARCPGARPAAPSASMTCRATTRRSVGSASSSAAPASYRLISSRSASSASNRSSWACRISALRSTAGSNPFRASCRTSAAIRTVVSGVRSSCDTSETNRRCTRDRSSSWRIWRCRLVAIRLNDAASRARSSSPRTRIRSSSRPAESRSAIRAAIRTGVTTCRVTSQAMPPTRSTRPSAASSSALRDQGEGVGLLVQREQEVQLVGADRRDDDRRADDEHRDRSAPMPG